MKFFAAQGVTHSHITDFALFAFEWVCAYNMGLGDLVTDAVVRDIRKYTLPALRDHGIPKGTDENAYSLLDGEIPYPSEPHFTELREWLDHFTNEETAASTTTGANDASNSEDSTYDGGSGSSLVD